MSLEERYRKPWSALLLGALMAVALELWWPGVWRWGSTPRFLVTVLIAAVTMVVLAARRGRS